MNNQYENWVSLIDARGPEFWQSRVKVAKDAASAYWWCWVITLSIQVRVGLQAANLSLNDGTVPIAITGVLWLVAAGVSFLASQSRRALIEFIPTTPLRANLSAFFLSVFSIGCFGPLAGACHSYFVKKATQHVEMAIQEQKSRQTPQVSHSATTPTVSKVALRQGTDALDVWCDKLDAYLGELKSSTRSSDFRPDALHYGCAHEMTPALFVRHGYNQSMSEAEFRLVSSADEPIESLNKVEDKIVEAPPAPMNPVLVSDIPLPEEPRSADRVGKVSTDSAESFRALRELYRLYQIGAISEDEFIALRQAGEG